MKLTELKIKAKHSFLPISDDNPLKCVVRIASEDSVVECVVGDETMHRILDLCASEIAKAAAEKMAEFKASVLAVEGNRAAALIGAE